MIAIIPARGGSKGLPGKNIKNLFGKPLIAYTIETAKAARNISRVIINTDDDEIARISVQYGAECPFMRPDFLATDEAKSIDVLKYTIEKLESLENISIDNFIVLQPTSPLKTSQDIDAAIDLFYSKNAHSVISYCAEHHPIKWHKYIDTEGKFENISEQIINNRQEERTSYFPNGSIYVFKKEAIYTQQYYTENSYAYIMERTKSVDIDTIDDFEYAEFLMSKSMNSI